MVMKSWRLSCARVHQQWLTRFWSQGDSQNYVYGVINGLKDLTAFRTLPLSGFISSETYFLAESQIDIPYQRFSLSGVTLVTRVTHLLTITATALPRVSQTDSALAKRWFPLPISLLPRPIHSRHATRSAHTNIHLHPLPFFHKQEATLMVIIKLLHQPSVDHCMIVLFACCSISFAIQLSFIPSVGFNPVQCDLHIKKWVKMQVLLLSSSAVAVGPCVRRLNLQLFS